VSANKEGSGPEPTPSQRPLECGSILVSETPKTGDELFVKLLNCGAETGGRRRQGRRPKLVGSGVPATTYWARRSDLVLAKGTQGSRADVQQIRGGANCDGTGQQLAQAAGVNL